MRTEGNGIADLDDAIGLIYEAALDPDAWPSVLARISDLGRGEHTTLFVFEPSTRRLVHALASAHVTTEPAAREAYLAHYAALDPRNAYGIQQPAGTRFNDYAFITEAEMARSEFYHDHLWPNGLGHVGATSLKADSGSIVGLAIHRSRRQGPFEMSELDFLDQLTPHLLRALRVQTRFAELEARRWADLALRDRLPFAIILVDERGRVVSLNHEAVRLLAAGDGLIERCGLLFAAHPIDQAALDHLIKNAVATAQERGTEGGGIVALRRPSTRRPLAAAVLPIPRRGGALSLDFGEGIPSYSSP